MLGDGANSGLGEATARALAQHNPGKLYLGARSRSKAEAALERIRASSAAAASANIEILHIDLASFESVKAAAARVNEDASRLDILQLNGGIAVVPHQTTTDGYELQFGTNYLGHALLTQLLMAKMLETARLPGADDAHRGHVIGRPSHVRSEGWHSLRRAEDEHDGPQGT